MQAQQNIYESSQKLDLIRHSLEIHRQQLPPESSIASELKQEIESTQAMSPGTFSALSETATSFATASSLARRSSLEQSGAPQPPPRASHRNSVSFSRAASVTGKLEVSELFGDKKLLYMSGRTEEE